MGDFGDDALRGEFEEEDPMLKGKKTPGNIAHEYIADVDCGFPKDSVHHSVRCSCLASDIKNAVAEAVKEAHDKMDALLNHCPDAECDKCAEIICPHKDFMHFHHDGCPSCGGAFDDMKPLVSEEAPTFKGKLPPDFKMKPGTVEFISDRRERARKVVEQLNDLPEKSRHLYYSYMVTLVDQLIEAVVAGERERAAQIVREAITADCCKRFEPCEKYDCSYLRVIVGKIMTAPPLVPEDAGGKEMT
jgi:hypothetical protein